jgi:hypothetical protein
MLFSIVALSCAATSAVSLAIVPRQASARDAPSGNYAPITGVCPVGLSVRRPTDAVRSAFPIFSNFRFFFRMMSDDHRLVAFLRGEHLADATK